MAGHSKFLSHMSTSTRYAALSVFAHFLFAVLLTVYLLLAAPAYEGFFRRWEIDVSVITSLLLACAGYLWSAPLLYVLCAVLILSADAVIHYLLYKYISLRALQIWGWCVAILLALVIGIAFTSIHMDFARLVTDLS